MKRTFLFLLLITFNLSFSQDKTTANSKVEEGIVLHDKGDYQGAITKYDEALQLDKDNLFALAEKVLTLNTMQKYDEVIKISKYVLEHYKEGSELKNIYVSLANALDESNNPEEALKTYEEGIKKFPDYYQLPFNKGITHASLQQYDEAITAFQQALLINPKHAGSINGMARVEKIRGNKIPSILSFCRFFTVEPQTKRAEENLKSLKELINSNVTKNEDNSINISIDSNTLSEGSKKRKSKENDFSSTELILSMSVALDYSEENKNKTEVENFIRKFEILCASMEENKKKKKGFYWEVIAPYFMDMKQNNLIVPFGYIVYASSGSSDVNTWLKSNQAALDKFYEWSKNYNWSKK